MLALSYAFLIVAAADAAAPRADARYAYDVDERAWKAKFEPAVAAVYAAINRKQPSR